MLQLSQGQSVKNVNVMYNGLKMRYGKPQYNGDRSPMANVMILLPVSVEDFLDKIDGKEISLSSGMKVLQTKDAAVTEIGNESQAKI